MNLLEEIFLKEYKNSGYLNCFNIDCKSSITIILSVAELFTIRMKNYLPGIFNRF